MASALEVIITEDCTAGKAGELTKVRPGYARNFLLPKGLAVVADAFEMAKYEERKAEIEAIAEEKRKAAEANKETLGEEASVEIVTKAGESGKLFGAITKEKIATSVTEQLNIAITKDNVKLSAPIKEVGAATVELDLGSNIKSQVIVKVIAE